MSFDKVLGRNGLLPILTFRYFEGVFLPGLLPLEGLAGDFPLTRGLPEVLAAVAVLLDVGETFSAAAPEVLVEAGEIFPCEVPVVLADVEVPAEGVSREMVVGTFPLDGEVLLVEALDEADLSDDWEEPLSLFIRLTRIRKGA